MKANDRPCPPLRPLAQLVITFSSSSSCMKKEKEEEKKEKMIEKLGIEFP
jgi:hypothetical protein